MASIPFNSIPLINATTLAGAETFPIESGGTTFRTSIKDILNIPESIPGSAIKSLNIGSEHLKANCVKSFNIEPQSINNIHIGGRQVTGPQVALKTLSAEHIVPDASFTLDRSITAKKIVGVSKVRTSGTDPRNGFPFTGGKTLSSIDPGTAPIFGVRAWGMIEACNVTSSGNLKYSVSLKSGGNVLDVFTTGYTTRGGWAVYKVKFEVPMPTEYYAVNITNGPFTNGDHTFQVLHQEKEAFYFMNYDPGYTNNNLQKITVSSYPEGLYTGAHKPYFYSTGEADVGIPSANWISSTNQGWITSKEDWFTPDDQREIYGNQITVDKTGENRRVSNAPTSYVYFTVVC